jgi:hypothetical protein
LDPDESFIWTRLHAPTFPPANLHVRRPLRGGAGLFVLGDIHGSIGECATRERAAWNEASI